MQEQRYNILQLAICKHHLLKCKLWQFLGWQYKHPENISEVDLLVYRNALLEITVGAGAVQPPLSAALPQRHRRVSTHSHNWIIINLSIAQQGFVLRQRVIPKMLPYEEELFLSKTSVIGAFSRIKWPLRSYSQT